MKLLKTAALLVLSAANIYAIQPTIKIKPSICISIDDGNTSDILSYKWCIWNEKIRKTLQQNNIQAAWFVYGMALNNERGNQLLKDWNNAGNVIANHTYNHLNYSDTAITFSTYISDINRCNKVIGKYSQHHKYFRCPYLESGNTVRKRELLNAWFKKHNFKQGWVTIDAFDWYFNDRLLSWLKTHPKGDLKNIRNFYVNNTFQKAQFCDSISHVLINRTVKHTILLHFNLSTALFLDDLIQKFKKNGWTIENYTNAQTDQIYAYPFKTLPARQNLLWAIGTEKRISPDILKFLAENKDGEKLKIDKSGIFK